MFAPSRGAAARFLVLSTYAGTCVRTVTSGRSFANGPIAARGLRVHMIANATNPCTLASDLSRAQVVKRHLRAWMP